MLQEVRHRNTGKKIIELNNGERYVFLWCGKKKRRDAGVGILIKRERGLAFSEPDFTDPRVMSLNMNIHGFKIRLVIGYSPTNISDSESLKDEFYRNLRKSIELCPKHHKLIVAGDFNAETSIVYAKNEFDGVKVVTDDICNNNGIRLKSFSRLYKLCMPQSFFDKPLPNRYTWYSSDGKTKKIIDYILLQRFVNQYVVDCEVNPEYNFESDHRLLTTTLSTPKNKKSRWKPKIAPKPKTNDKLLVENKYKSDYVKKSSEHLKASLRARTGIESSEEISNWIEDSLKNAAKDVLPQKVKRNVKQVWKDDSVLNDLLERKALCNRKSIEHKQLCKKVKSRIRKIRNDKVSAEANELNTYASKREIETLYKAFKDDGSTFKQLPSKKGCDPAKLKEYFENHFQTKTNSEETDPFELTEAPDFIKNLKQISTTCQINCNPPSKDEIICTLKQLKNGKSSNDIPAIYLKSAIDSIEVLNEMTKLYDAVWKTEKIPQKWSHSRLITIWKGATKGKIDDPSAYRGIQIGSTFCKVLVIIILERIRTWYEKQISDHQQGFRQGRGTTDGIYLVKRIQQLSYRSKKPIFVLFVDLSAAFDHINRKWLFKSIYQRLATKESEKLFKLLEKIYAFTTTALQENEKDIFNVILGVRQGGPESPTLFNLYIDYVMRIYLTDCKKHGINFMKSKFKIPNSALCNNELLGKYGENYITWLGYADDLVLFFEDKDNLKKALILLNDTFRRFQLNINAKKTETMILNFNDLNYQEYPDSLCELDKCKIKNVKLFKYLGSNIDYRDASTGDSEINQRLDSAEAKFYEHSKKLLNYKVHLRIRVVILNALVRSRLTYGCQTWTLSAEQKRKINSFYCGLLRRLVRGGFKRKPDSFAFMKSNEELLVVCKTESIDKFIAKLQRRYLAHIIRREDDSLVKTLTFNDDPIHVPGPYTTLRNSVMKREEIGEREFHARSMSNLI